MDIVSELTTPAQIDTALAEKLFLLSKAERDIENQLRYRNHESAYYREHVFSAATLQEAQDKADALNDTIGHLNSLYTGWPRYWHVTNTNGHIHTSQNCTTCYWDTQYGWRTDLSGLTPEEVVEREAYNACSVCMPIAPAEQKAARVRYNKEQHEAKAAEKAAAKAEKDVKKLERARKHVEKVEKLVVEHCGSWDAFWNEYSLYGHDGRKSVYALDVPAMVHDTLYALKAQQEGDKSSLRNLNEFVKTALEENGRI